ncbi:MAG: 3'(2'),5'-bisphosphate nucleotidase CysQ [Pseudomonadota bacterium]
MPEAETSGAAPSAAARDRALLVAAAEAAGQVALDYQGRALKTWDKDAGQGPVSEADLAVNAVLAEQLRTARPDYGWLSEEDTDDPARLTTERVFVVDPIDGTRAFLDGQKGFAVALAVVEHGRAVAACVHLPARGETYAAHLGGGATLGEVPLLASARTSLDGAKAIASKNQLQPEHWPGGVPALDLGWRPALEWRLCLVASGRHDLTFTFRPAWEWDIAAGSLIASEAGVRVSDGQGQPLVLNAATPRAAGLIAAPPALHTQVLARRSAEP